MAQTIAKVIINCLAACRQALTENPGGLSWTVRLASGDTLPRSPVSAIIGYL
jgi:hypothetical protein